MSAVSRLEVAPDIMSANAGDTLRVRSESGDPAILALFENEASIPSVARHAVAMSQVFGHRLTMTKVSEFANGDSPVDPISWRAGQFDYRQDVHAVLARYGADSDGELWLDIDRSPYTLRCIVRKAGASIVVISRAGDEEGLGATALDLLEHTDLSLLVVPETDRPGEGRYRRILLPIDGSSRADSVVPLARQMAASHGATITLAHVLHGSPLSQSRAKMGGMAGSADRQSDERHRAERHMDGLKRQLISNGFHVDVEIRGPADPRLSLLELIKERGFDLIVASAHGQSALPHTPCGSVARHLLSLSPAPILLIRHGSNFNKGTQKAAVQEQAIFCFKDD